MRKFFIAAALLVFAAFQAKSQSENFRNFKFDITSGYASPARSGGSNSVQGGVTFGFHPHFRLSDELAVGLRFEGAALGYVKDYSDDFGEYSEVKVAILASYCATAEYYLSNGTFRPFIGAGAGMFSQSSVSASSTDTTTTTTLNKAKFGFFPEAGFEIWHFRVSADYNVLPNQAGYWSIKTGFFFGGGRKEGSGRGHAPHGGHSYNRWGG